MLRTIEADCMVMVTWERSIGVVTFMTLRIRVLLLRCGDGSNIVKMHCFFGLITVTRGSAFAPDRREVILSGS